MRTFHPGGQSWLNWFHFWNSLLLWILGQHLEYANESFVKNEIIIIIQMGTTILGEHSWHVKLWHRGQDFYIDFFEYFNNFAINFAAFKSISFNIWTRQDLIPNIIDSNDWENSFLGYSTIIKQHNFHMLN